jgi:MGT family glycosyltransferase
MGHGIFLNLPNASGHINPTLAVVRALTEAGEHITYYAGPEAREAIERHGARFVPYPDPMPFDGAGYHSVLETGCAMVELTERAMPLLKQLAASRPDYVLFGNCCPWGKLLAEHLGVPSICTTSTLVSTVPMVLGDPLLILDLLPLARIPTLWGLYRRINACRAQLGLRPRNPIAALIDIFRNEADLNLVFTLPAMQRGAALLSKRYRFVGTSCELDRNCAMPFDRAWLADDSLPLVYVSLGTIHNERPGFYAAVVEGLRTLPCRVLVATGPKFDLACTADVPERFRMVPFTPQLEVLQQASVFISHAGMNSLNESLYFGVPLLLVPQTVEQEVNARRVRSLGAGLLLHRNPTPQQIHSGVERLLQQDRYRQQAQRLAQNLRACGGAQAAAAAIGALVHGNTAHYQAPSGARKTGQEAS